MQINREKRESALSRRPPAPTACFFAYITAPGFGPPRSMQQCYGPGHDHLRLHVWHRRSSINQGGNAHCTAQAQLATLRRTKIDENRYKIVQRPAKIGNIFARLRDESIPACWLGGVTPPRQARQKSCWQPSLVRHGQETRHRGLLRGAWRRLCTPLGLDTASDT